MKILDIVGGADKIAVEMDECQELKKSSRPLEYFDPFRVLKEEMHNLFRHLLNIQSFIIQ